MTRIDFHSNVADKIGYACRLVRKARAANCQVVLYADDRAQIKALDEALWVFSELDFLPHVMAEDALAPCTPIIIADKNSNELPHYQILINLKLFPLKRPMPLPVASAIATINSVVIR